MTKILIFENDPTFAVELRGELSRLGCTVQVFQDGNAGLIAAANSPPDLILVSVELPRVNGFSICNKVKKDARLRSVPLIIMSSLSTQETFEQHQRLPTRADDYVHTPIAFAALLPRMQRLARIGARGSNADPLLVADDNDEFETMQVSAGDVAKAIAARGIRLPAVRGGEDQEQPSEDSVAQGVLGFGAPATGQPASSFAPAETSPPASFIPEYHLGDDDEDEVERTRVALDDLERRQEAGRPTPTHGAGGWPAATSDDAHALREELIASKRSLHAALLQLSQLKRSAGDPEELARLRTAAADAERLRHELDSVRTELASRSSSSAVSEREALNLRERVNARDRELLELREELSAKERELLHTRDEALANEREMVERKGQLIESRAKLDEASAHLEALLADKALADKRAADFKAGAKKIADQLNQRGKELRELQVQHEESLSQQEQRAALMLREQEEKLRSELREAEQSHQAQIARLRKEHEESLGRASQGALSARSELEDRATAELEALKTALGSTRAELAELGREHEEALARAAAAGSEQASASEARERQMLDALRTELESEHAERLDGAARQHQEELLELTRQHDETVERELTAELSRHESAQAELQQRLDELGAALAAATDQAAELGAVAAELDGVKRERDALGTKVQELETRVAALEESTDRLREELELVGAERDDFNVQCAALGEQNVELGEELDAARAEIAELGRRAKAERAARDRARQALAAVVSQLDAGQEEPADGD